MTMSRLLRSPLALVTIVAALAVAAWWWFGSDDEESFTPRPSPWWRKQKLKKRWSISRQQEKKAYGDWIKSKRHSASGGNFRRRNSEGEREAEKKYREAQKRREKASRDR